jgi:hypothetical protein
MEGKKTHLTCAELYHLIIPNNDCQKRIFNYILYMTLKKIAIASCQRLTPVIPATWETEIGRIAIQGQHRQIVLKPPSPK